MGAPFLAPQEALTPLRDHPRWRSDDMNAAIMQSQRHERGSHVV
jgi:hypothetical protein